MRCNLNLQFTCKLKHFIKLQFLNKSKNINYKFKVLNELGAVM